MREEEKVEKILAGEFWVIEILEKVSVSVKGVPLFLFMCHRVNERAEEKSWLEMLLSKGADPNVHGRLGSFGSNFEFAKQTNFLCEGETPLCFAVRVNNIRIAKFLLQNGADPNLKGCGDRTPLVISFFFLIFLVLFEFFDHFFR